MADLQYNAGSFWSNPSLSQGSAGGSFWSNPSATYGQTGYLSGNMDAQQFFGASGIGQGGGNWFSSANNWMGSESFLGGDISNGALANTGMGVLNMGVNMLAGKNHSKVGDVLQGIGGLASNIPGVGGLIGGAVGVVGGLINAAFGSSINEEFVAQTKSQSNALGSRIFNGNTSGDVLNDWKSFITQSHVRKSEVGSDGWFSSEAEDTTDDLNDKIDEANKRQLANFKMAVDNADANTDFRILSNSAAYGGPIDSFRKYYDKGGYLNTAKAAIRQHEGWSAKPYADAPKGKNWKSVGYGFNDSGFREKYPEGISKHYAHGITKEQAEKELDYFLSKAEKTLKGIYGKQWNEFTDNQKAAILDTYYQRPASVGKSSRFYKAVTAGEDPTRFLGVAGFGKRNQARQQLFSGNAQGYSDDYSSGYSSRGQSVDGEELAYPTFNSLLEATSPVVEMPEITPTQAQALNLNLSTPSASFLQSFGRTPQQVEQTPVPTIGTVEDFLASYGDFDEALFACGGKLHKYNGGGWMDFFNSWNTAQGGSQGAYGSNWKLSDGLQKNTSNGNVGDWLGVAGTVMNTIGNWGKEDPTLGRGGGYSTFGMATYDIMKVIRDATRSKRETISEKLGIPIYYNGGRLFSDGGSVGAMGYAQVGTAALKLASNAVHQASLDNNIDEDAIHRSINRYGQDFDKIVGNVNTNGDLLDLWQHNATINPNLSAKDFRNKSYFDDFLDSFAASWEGFNAGQNFGPWGAAIGAIVGGGSSVIGSIIGRNKADNAADEANARIEEANERRMDNLLLAADRVDQENDFRILQNMGKINEVADGGSLNMGFGLRSPFVLPQGTANPLYKAFGGSITHGADWDTSINWVNEGGSHGENPLGGVPYGIDQDGVPNLVEEGEAVWNGDYVFSRRMKVPKKLAKKYGLGGDLTFADAVKKLTNNSEERPLDEIDQNTNDNILGEFADAQEEKRAIKAQHAMEKQIQLQDDYLMGMQFGLGGRMTPLGLVPNENNTSFFDLLENKFGEGGGIHIDPSKRGTFKAQASKMGMGVQQAASHILANKENYSPAMVKKAVFAHNFAHADGGSLFTNPFGAEANVFDLGGDIKRVQDNLRKNGLTDDQIDEWISRNKPEWRNEYWKNHRLTDNWQAESGKGVYYKAHNNPTQVTSNKETENNKQAIQSSQSSKSSGTGTKGTGTGTKAKAKSAVARQAAIAGLNPYAFYTNGSDGYSKPWGFTVGQNGLIDKNTGYTDDYRNLVASLGAKDIKNWAKNHANDTSLRSFLDNNYKGKDYVEKLNAFINDDKFTDDMWRTGATDGKYGFMHHVAAEIGKDQIPEFEAPSFTAMAGAVPEDTTMPEQGLLVFDPKIMGNADAMAAGTRSTTTDANGTNVTRVTGDGTTTGTGKNKTKQTWTRNVPWIMSGLMGLKEILTPADYTNANAIMDAAYRAGTPVSVGTEYIGDYRKRSPFDQTYLMNIINQNGIAADRNMMNLSGGNRAVAQAGILANNLATQRSLAEATRQAYLANRTDDAQVAEFNRGTNLFNAQAQNTRNLSLAQLNSQRQQAMLSGIAQGARLRQAIKDQRDAAISANLSAFAQGLGDLGNENGYYNMLAGLNDENVLKYFYGNDWKTMFNNQSNG